MSGPMTPKIMNAWLSNKNSGDLIWTAQRFNPDSENHNVAWSDSFEHGMIVIQASLGYFCNFSLTGITKSIQYIKNDCNNSPLLITVTKKSKEKLQIDEEKIKRLHNNTRRIELVSTLALEFLLAAREKMKPNNAIVQYKICSNENICAKRVDTICISLEQASFLVCKPKSITSHIKNDPDSAPVYDKLWGDDSSVFGWNPECIAIKTENYHVKSESLTSLMHYPAFFHPSHRPSAQMVPFLKRKKKIIQSKPNGRHHEILWDEGILRYMATYKNEYEHLALPVIFLWIGLGPKNYGNIDKIQANDDLIGTFWSFIIKTAIQGAPELLQQIFESITDKIRYLLLLAFSRELLDELENKQQKLIEQQLKLEIIANDHKKIQGPLENMLRNLQGLQGKARMISQVVNPEGALFVCRQQIGDLFSDKQGVYIHGFPLGVNITYEHDPAGWKEDNLLWVAAKIARLLSGNTKVLETNAHAAWTNAWHEMVKDFTHTNDIKRMQTKQRIRVFLNSSCFSHESKDLLDIKTNNLRRLKERFHSIYKYNFNLHFDTNYFRAFMPMVSFPTVHKKFSIENTFPLKSMGYLVEIIAVLIFHRWKEVKKERANINVKFDLIRNNDFLIIKISFKNFLKKSNDDVKNLYDKFSHAYEQEDIADMEMGNMVTWLMKMKDYTRPKFELRHNKNIYDNNIIFQWYPNNDNSRPDESLLYINMNPEGIYVRFKGIILGE
ncbi:MAG: hypothetical protein COA36_12810 [Desulfotalea sp.]|nr:MAG: hypothetical protein COA36_12810 [Desulfotalea sp.]